LKRTFFKGDFMNFKELGENIGLEEDEYRELVELFLDTGLADVDQLTSAMDADDAQQVARSAHTINGASGNLGIMNVHEVAKRIELAAIENRLEAVAGDMVILKGFFDEIAGFVRT
jgi:HPt (histidine-containing phosphotransfer) domain-containing protein